MTPTLRAHLQIHFCVLLWGFTAILGKLITLPAAALVWWRMALVAGALALLPSVWRALRQMPKRLLAIYALIGVLVGLHWLTFYASIKLANASVAATMMALAPVILSLIEPRISKRRFDARELALAIVALPGIALVVGAVPQGMLVGVAIGALSAVFVALFAALNKRYVDEAPPLAITAIEMSAGVALLSSVLLIEQTPLPIPNARDALWLITLAGACTLLPFTLSLVALKQLSAFAAQLAINLEPLYTIVIAMILFAEHRELNAAFYLGVALLVGATLIHPWLKPRGLNSPAEPA
jgi:drug/metabolite transporter (DMT)-like permease